MLTVHYDLAYIHQGHQGWLINLFAKNLKKFYNLGPQNIL